MRITNRILVVVDPDLGDSQASISRGAWLAGKQEVGLELFVCFSEALGQGDFYTDARGLEKVRLQMVKQRREHLEKIAEPLRDQGLDVSVSVVWDSPLDDGIVRHVLRTAPSMVVKETHYHAKIARVLFSHSDWGLIRKCPVPLLLAKGNGWTEGSPVVASVDPLNTHPSSSALDERILDMANDLAGLTSGHLHVYHGYLEAGNLLPVPAYVPEGMPVTNEQIERAHTDAMNNLMVRHGDNPEAVHVMPGRVEKELPSLVSKLDAGVVVMGAVNRNVLERVLIGSTAERVMDKLPCDLLVVKPTWFTTKLGRGHPRFYEGSHVID